MTLNGILDICLLFQKLSPTAQHLVTHLIRGTKPTRSYGDQAVAETCSFLDALYSAGLEVEVQELYVFQDLL